MNLFAAFGHQQGILRGGEDDRKLTKAGSILKHTSEIFLKFRMY